MSHAEETTQLWNDMLWVESVCDRWDAFFYSLIDQPNRALALCSLGIMVVSGQSTTPPQSVGSRWYSFFGSLAGRTDKAKDLCALGLEVVLTQKFPGGENIRNQVRSILMSKAGSTASA